MSRWRVYLWPLASCAPFIGLSWHQRWSLVASMYSCPSFPRHWDATWGVRMESRQWTGTEIQLKLLHFVDSQWAVSSARTREQASTFLLSNIRIWSSGIHLTNSCLHANQWTQNKNKRERKLLPAFSQVSVHVVIIRLLRFVCSWS